MGSVTRDTILADAAALDAARTFLRIDGDDEDATLAGLLAAAIGQCEAFTGRMLLRRAARETLRPDAVWQQLIPAPVRAITRVEALAVDGSTSPVGAERYELDIDPRGRGRLRFLSPIAAGRVVVTVEAGEAAGWSLLDDLLRQGILRHVAHYHAYRERADDLGPPAAVHALWRGGRQVQL